MFPRHALDDGGNQCRLRLGDTDPQFASRRVGEILDLVGTRPQIVEDGQAALEQCAAIERRLDALGAAIE